MLKITQYFFQSTLNIIIDAVIAEGIEELQKKNLDRIRLPNINETFTIGTGVFKTIGHIVATNGNFR